MFACLLADHYYSMYIANILMHFANRL